MARSKKDKQLVVNQAYFELIEQKAELLDSMFEDGELKVAPEHFKTHAGIEKAWDKVGADRLSGTEEPYTPPAE